MLNLFYKVKTLEELPPAHFKAINLGISMVPLLFAIFYPNIGTVLSYASSVSGFFMIYLVPVMAYMKMKKLEILHPLLAAAIQENEVDLLVPSRRDTLPKNLMSSPKMGRTAEEDVSFETTTPKLVINDRFLERQKLVSQHERINNSDKSSVPFSDSGASEQKE